MSCEVVLCPGPLWPVNHKQSEKEPLNLVNYSLVLCAKCSALHDGVGGDTLFQVEKKSKHQIFFLFSETFSPISLTNYCSNI